MDSNANEEILLVSLFLLICLFKEKFIYNNEILSKTNIVIIMIGYFGFILSLAHIFQLYIDVFFLNFPPLRELKNINNLQSPCILDYDPFEARLR